MRNRLLALTAILLSFTLLAAACGDDDVEVNVSTQAESTAEPEAAAEPEEEMAEPEEEMAEPEEEMAEAR